ncbi:MAG: ABC transporter permease subunit [Oscillospiraceae bacterium]|jgi:ABC-type transport system involved in multi-copper enzyme maturation permease subunit|nr:ABC transporter permease subunit [Oscillospiraceae bacterium]
MSLFRFELRKLLINKRTLTILGALLILYIGVGFGTSYFIVGSGEAYNTYADLARPLEGPVNEEYADVAMASYEAAKERYGDNEEAIYYGTSGDPVLKFNVDYAHFVGHVDEYYNGALFDSLFAPYGVNVLQSRLTELEQSGQAGGFEYRSTKNQLDKEVALGEPRFANTLEWGNLLANWGDTLMLFLLFIPLLFIISPVFSMEASTGMDNLILSSRNGRRKIVAAKIGAVVITAVAVLAMYLLATFIFGFFSVGTLEGATAALRSVPNYVRAPFGFSNAQFTVVSALWILLSGTAFALIVSFISSRFKNQIAVCGVSLAVLLLNIGIAALGTTIENVIKPVVDFGVASFALVGEIFTQYKVYNVFGVVVPYYVMLIVFLVLVIGLTSFGMFWGQRKRTVA